MKIFIVILIFGLMVGVVRAEDITTKIGIEPNTEDIYDIGIGKTKWLEDVANVYFRNGVLSCENGEVKVDQREKTPNS